MPQSRSRTSSGPKKSSDNTIRYYLLDAPHRVSLRQVRENRRIAIAKKFLRAVWGGDLAVSDALMSEEVVFIDSCGERLKGFAECSKAARAFASLEPDCRVTISEAFERGDAVMLRVELAVTDPRIVGPYLVSMKFADDRICEWQTHRHNRVPYARVLRRAIAAEALAGESGIDTKPAPR